MSPEMEESSTREPLLTPIKGPSNGIVVQLSANDQHPPKSESSSFADQGNNLNYNDKQDSIRDVVGSKNTNNGSNLNQTRVAGLFWISNARLLCFIMALDLMTTSVQVPSLTAVFESHGMDLRWQGWVSSVYGIISFFVGPMLGRVSDSVGRVHMLRLSALGSMVCALGSLHATSKWPFIIARIVPGLTKCSLPISQAYMVDVSQGNAERSKHLGMLGASFGMAFVLGPPLGGWAADLDPRYPFVIAVLEGALLLAALHFMPEPSPLRKNGHKRLKSSASSADVSLASASMIGGGGGGGSSSHCERGDSVVAPLKGTPSSSFSPNGDTGSSINGMRRTKSSSLLSAEIGRSKAMLLVPAKSVASIKGAAAGTARSDAGVVRKGRLSVFRGPGGRQLGWGFHDRFFFVVAETLYHAAFAPFLTEVLGFPPGTIGELLSFMGAVSALTNAFLVGFLTERFGEKPLMTTSLLVLAVGWVMWSAVTVSTTSILAALTMVGVGDNVFQTVNKAAVAQHAPPELVGTVMGMSGAMDTFGRTLASPMCGYIFKAWGARGVPVTCACAAAYVAVALSVRGFTAAAAAAATAAAGTGGDACEETGVGRSRASEVKRRWKERDH